MEDSLLNRAFEIDEITDDFDPSVLPSTGQEYLQHVMYEASKCPQVVVANIDRRKIKNHINIQLESDCFSGKSELVPSVEWQQYQIALFSDLRKKVELCKKSNKLKPMTLPKAHNEEKWYDLCFGDDNSKEEPTLTLLLSMTEPLMARVLEYHAEWLDDGLKPNQGKWVYCLLACLDLPLTSDTCSAVRNLAKKCAKIRSTKASIKDSDITILNLIICLVGKYFGQADLAD